MSDQQPAPQTTDKGRTARLVVALVIVAAVVAVAVDNRNEVEVGYVVGDVSAPLWVVLVAAGIAGIVVGWLVKHRPGRRD
jgi:uncharacterized integral membrane protein